MAAGGSTRAIMAALFANAGIAIAKFVGFLVTASASLLAEAVHSVADTSNQALLLMGGRRARRAATTDHPFGYGRERYFWSFVVALVLFSLGSLFAIYEGINKLRDPHDVDHLLVAIIILSLGIVLESWSFRTAIVEANLVRGRHSWGQFIRRSRTPELPVVLLEDLGALIGLVLALVAVVLAEITGDARWDGVGTVSIGVLLGIIAIVLAIEMKSLLIGESAVPEHRKKLIEALSSSDDVSKLIHMKSQHLGPDELLVAAKVAFASDLDTVELAAAIDNAEKRMREAVPIARIIYLEPDLFRDDYDSTRDDAYDELMHPDHDADVHDQR